MTTSSSRLSTGGIFALLIVALACSGDPLTTPAGLSNAPDLNATAFHDKFSDTYEVFVYDQCTDEWLSAVLTETVWVTVVENESGLFLTRYVYDVRGTVSSPDGTEYKLLMHNPTIVTVTPGALASNWNFSMKLIGRGRLNNEVLRSTYRIILNANGEIVVQREKWEVRCVP